MLSLKPTACSAGPAAHHPTSVCTDVHVRAVLFFFVLRQQTHAFLMPAVAQTQQAHESVASAELQRQERSTIFRAGHETDERKHVGCWLRRRCFICWFPGTASLNTLSLTSRCIKLGWTKSQQLDKKKYISQNKKCPACPLMLVVQCVWCFWVFLTQKRHFLEL